MSRRAGSQLSLAPELDTIPATLPPLGEIAQRGRAWDVSQGPEAADDPGPLAPECLVPVLGRNSRLIGLLVLGQRHFGRVLLEYVGGCVQARQVGGDYFDFLNMRPGVVGIVLADISGKGMSGALLMANLQANLRGQYAVALDDLPRLLRSVNRLFYENTTDESYATMFFGVYDDSCRSLRFANCGHIAPLILRTDGSIQRLTSTTTVLGLFLKWESPIEEEKVLPFRGPHAAASVGEATARSRPR